ncbi:MAG: hypothetical protein FWD12_03195 [Alphaproteobacteria bacterium]|nr:hypothetical protein [Alphaproteobacteria bacterium]
MRTAVIAAAAALSLMGAQAAYADAVQRYESGASLQSMAAPQQARPYAQAAQTGTEDGSLHQTLAEQTAVVHQAQGAPSAVYNSSRPRNAEADQTGVVHQAQGMPSAVYNSSRPRNAEADQTGAVHQAQGMPSAVYNSSRPRDAEADQTGVVHQAQGMPSAVYNSSRPRNAQAEQTGTDAGSLRQA